MGGCASSPVRSNKKISPVGANPENNKVQESVQIKPNIVMNAKSPHVRVDCSKEVKKFHVQGDRYSFNLSYCYVSQRGYYPHGNKIILVNSLVTGI